jgi:hypothetical protein
MPVLETKGQTLVMTGSRPPGEAIPAIEAAFDPLYADVQRVLQPMYDAAARALAGAALDQRRGMCERIAARYPIALGEPKFVSLLRSYGWSPLDPVLASSALEKMQELARWYLGSERVLSTEAELLAFKEHQRRALDEMIVGFVRLTGGLDKFEHELALRQDAGPAWRSPEELVRQLLDWAHSSDDALQHVRASFAELMMHQVALLQGVMRGVKALLEELSPPVIEALARERRGKKFLPFGRADLWAAYKERHADFSDEEGERFRVLFGAEFAAEYRGLAAEARAGASRSQAPPGGTMPLRSGR